MGCFLACFGSSKNHKHIQHRRRGHSRLNHVSSAIDPDPRTHCTPTGIRLTPSSKQDYLQKPINLIEDSGVKEKEQLSSSKRVQSEGQLSSGTRKKVTFDSNITVYERVSVDESAEVVHYDPGVVAETGIVADSAKPSNSASAKLGNPISASKNSSSSSSLGSYRYQNCRESDGEDEEFDHDEEGHFEGDVIDHNEDEDGYGDDDELSHEDSDDEFYHGDGGQELSPVSFPSLESRTNSSQPFMVDSMAKDGEFQVQDGRKKMLGSEGNARDRSRYVNAVLNPVENTTQWRTLKAKESGAMKLQKENIFSQEEPPLLLVSREDPSLKQSAVGNLEEPMHDEEIGVDASLSSWLVSSKKTPKEKTKAADLDAIPSTTSASSYGSNSLLSEEGRPMSRAATVEEFKQFSASSTTIRNLADTPLIGTVRSCWNSASPVKDSGSVSSFKGIPNTSSKYREDRRVTWHSTPFETRLDRALKKGST